MKQAILALALLPVVLSGSAVAQGTPQRKPQIGSGAWWRNPEFSNQLHLSPAQVKDFEQSFTQHNLKVADASADAQRESVRIDSLLQTDAPEQELLTEVNKLADARCRILREQILMFYDARHILTAEQWHKFQGMRAASAYENAANTGAAAPQSANPQAPH